jgi:hypothetical protein
MPGLAAGSTRSRMAFTLPPIAMAGVTNAVAAGHTTPGPSVKSLVLGDRLPLEIDSGGTRSDAVLADTILIFLRADLHRCAGHRIITGDAVPKSGR